MKKITHCVHFGNKSNYLEQEAEDDAEQDDFYFDYCNSFRESPHSPV